MLSENPSSLRFRMDKNSATATELKASITNKLNQFLVNYTDDVLAEYIVVLVCNGKDQNQASDHLEAFLGDRSAEFVSWLWDLLLRSVDDSHVLGVVKNNHKNRMQRGRLNHVRGDANTLLNDEHEYNPSTFVPQPVSLDNNEVSEGSQHCSQGSDTSLNEIEIKRRKKTFRLPKISRPTEKNYSEVSQYAPSEAKVSSRVSDSSEQSMIPLNENKIISSYENHLPQQPIPLAKYERPSCNLRSITKENPKYGLPAGTDVTGKRFSSRPIGSMSNRNDDTRRGSVWDRLGKAGDVSITTRGKNNDVHNVDVEKGRILEHRGEAHDWNKLMQFLPGARFNGSLKRGISASDICSDTVISNNSNDDDYKKLEYDLSPVHKTNRKRQFSEIGSVEESKYKQLDHTKPLKQFERLSSAKYNSTESLNSISSGTRQTELPHTCPDVFTKELNGEALDSTKTNVKPVQSQLLEMKLRLHQIEMQMSKLKTKQLERNGGKLELLPNFGALNHSDEDVESRTVFVTNVHFAATKEALSLHFSKCGVIVNITILKEPKGAAYITFIQKEAAEKAVTLSGTSFWSRTLKIVRKRELPVVAPLLAGNPSLPRSLQPNRKIVFPRPYAGSLQWRRDQVVSTGCSVYAPRNGLEGSETVQQKSNDSEGQLCDLSVTNTNTAKEEEEPTVTPDKEQSKETQDKEKRDESGENQASMKICAAT